MLQIICTIAKTKKVKKKIKKKSEYDMKRNERASELVEQTIN